MKINWKVRVKNPVFWVEIAVAVIIPILIGEVYMMLSDKRNMPTKCSVVNHPPIFTIR